MRYLILIMLIILGFIFLICDVRAEPYVDLHYCGRPTLNTNGTNHRSAKELYAFRKNNPCPSTQLTSGACPFWSIDHERPLEACGCDNHNNMHWMKNTIKSCAGTECKDRWELKIYTCKPEDL